MCKFFSRLIVLLSMLICVSNVWSFTDEEQLIYDSLYLNLPWEAGVYQFCTQLNQDTPTHKPSSLDEYALDFGMATGTEVKSADYGVAYPYYEDSTKATAYGNHVKVDHGYFYTLYAHLSSIDSSISPSGVEIGPGYTIGKAGNTGTSTNPHLHFGLYLGNAWEDGYSPSVKSKIIIGHSGEGPYQSIESTTFDYGYYLSANFEHNYEGMIVCNEDNSCYVDITDGTGGYDDEAGTTDGPDANVKKVELDKTGNNWHHSYTVEPEETLQSRVTITNKGDEIIDYFETKIFRSNDLDFDKDKDYSYGREEEEDDLKPGDKTHKHRTITAPATPGIYRIFAYINHVEGENGDDDQDWSNNYSRNDDPEEYAVLIVAGIKAKFSTSITSGVAPLTVNFTDKSLGEVVSWAWDFGDGTTSTEQNPSHTFSAGSYTVTLIVTGSEGEVRTTSTTITVATAPPSVTFIDPHSGTNWRSDKDRWIKWTYKNTPSNTPIKIEYTCDEGSMWKTVYNGYTTINNQPFKWKMDKKPTKDSKNSYVRILIGAPNYTQEIGRSEKFEIDHASGDPKW